MEADGAEEGCKEVTQAHVFISGSVQGVGYRQFVKNFARRAGITGWVRNLPDGRVEAVVQGKKETVEHLVEDFSKGPFLAEVKDVEVIWEEGEEVFGEFIVR